MHPLRLTLDMDAPLAFMPDTSEFFLILIRLILGYEKIHCL
jgi:hypothetical protein